MSLGPWHPAEIGPEWRRVVGDVLWSSLPRLWLPEYDSEAVAQLDQLLSRAMDGLTQGGRLDSLSECRVDAVLGMRHVDVAEIEQRGDRRYGPDVMAEFLRKNPTLDLVPIILGMRKGRLWVLDGHHRFRAYALVGRPALAYTCKLERGTGRIRIQ